MDKMQRFLAMDNPFSEWLGKGASASGSQPSAPQPEPDGDAAAPAEPVSADQIQQMVQDLIASGTAVSGDVAGLVHMLKQSLEGEASDGVPEGDPKRPKRDCAEKTATDQLEEGDSTATKCKEESDDEHQRNKVAEQCGVTEAEWYAKATEEYVPWQERGPDPTQADAPSTWLGQTARSGKNGGLKRYCTSGGTHRKYYVGYYRAKGKGKAAILAYVQKYGPPPSQGGKSFHEAKKEWQVGKGRCEP